MDLETWIKLKIFWYKTYGPKWGTHANINTPTHSQKITQYNPQQQEEQSRICTLNNRMLFAWFLNKKQKQMILWMLMRSHSTCFISQNWYLFQISFCYKTCPFAIRLKMNIKCLQNLEVYFMVYLYKNFLLPLQPQGQHMETTHLFPFLRCFTPH